MAIADNESALPLGIIPRARARTAAHSTWLAVGLPAAAALMFYGVFIARSAVTIAGHKSFALFDDSMISMRYAYNFAHGHGLVYNVGLHPVEGYTNFLWTLYMSLVQLLPISITQTSLVIELTGAALLLGCGLVVARIARLLVPESRAVTALAVTASLFFYPLVFWTLRGMEVGLATLLILSLVLTALRLRDEFSTRRLLILGALAGLAVLVRDDLLVPTSVIFVFAVAWSPLGRRRRAALLLVAPLAASIGAHEAFRLAYYGDPLPNTYYLKLSGSSVATRAQRGFYVLASTFVLSLFAPIALAVGAVWSRRRERDSRLWLLVAVIASLFAYTVYVGGDVWENFRFADRFLTPAAPLLFILGAMALHRLVRHGRQALSASPVLAVLAAAAALSLLPATSIAYWLEDESWTAGLRGAMGRAALPLLAAAVFVGLLLALKRSRWRSSSPAVAVLLTAGLGLLLVLPNARTYRNWLSSNATSVQLQNGAMVLGLALHDLTTPHESIAISSAGNIAYFSQRRVDDLLGVNDAHIAREPAKMARFIPGHTKWDYAYSIGALRPDLIYGLYGNDPTGLIARVLHSLGYVAAEIRFSPLAGDAAPQGTLVYLSPAMAKRASREPAPPGSLASFVP